MKIDDAASIIDPRTGQRVSVRRQIEAPDDTDERCRQGYLDLERMALRGLIAQVLADQALGLDVTERMRELCDAFAALGP